MIQINKIFPGLARKEEETTERLEALGCNPKNCESSQWVRGKQILTQHGGKIVWTI